MSNVSIDLIISFLEAFCCQMFFDIFIDENQDRKGRAFKVAAMMVLGLLYFGLGRLLPTQFIVKELIVIAVTAITMIVLRDFKLKKAPILAILFQGLLVAMEYLAYVFIQMIVSDALIITESEETISTFIAIMDMLLIMLQLYIHH